MKYEVGKAYLHDGSAECPLPKGAVVSFIADQGGASGPADRAVWTRILCFVPTYIPPQPREWWIALDKNGEVVAAYMSKEKADRYHLVSSLSDETIHVREVTE